MNFVLCTQKKNPWSAKILNYCQRKYMECQKITCIKPFQACFIHTFFHAQLTTIEEVNVVWQRLVVRREVGSIVFKKPPFHPIFVLLFLPPDKDRWWKKWGHIWESENRCALVSPCVCVCACVCAGGGSRSYQNEESSISQPSPAILLLLLLLFDLQLSCLLNLLLCPLRFFSDWLLSFLFLYRLYQEKHWRFKHSHHELHLQQTSYSASFIDGDRLPQEGRYLPFLFSSLTSFSELLRLFLLPAHVAFFFSLGCR